MIDTSKIKSRRELRFATLGEAIGDAESLAVAESESKLHQRGNWSLGQAVAHVAFWAEAPFDGYPPGLKVTWFAKLMMRFLRGRILNTGMMAGVKIPNAPGGTYGADDLPVGEAVERLRAAFARLDADCPAEPNPLFGSMTHTQWKQLNLRHAELHFSFFYVE